MRFEQSKEGREERITMDASKDIVAKDIVISYSTEQIKEPLLVLTKWNKYPNKIVAHILILLALKNMKLMKVRFYLIIE